MRAEVHLQTRQMRDQPARPGCARNSAGTQEGPAAPVPRGSPSFPGVLLPAPPPGGNEEPTGAKSRGRHRAPAGRVVGDGRKSAGASGRRASRKDGDTPRASQTAGARHPPDTPTRQPHLFRRPPPLSVQFSRSVVSDSLRPHESQHARPPCPSPTPGVHPDSRPSSQ